MNKLLLIFLVFLAGCTTVPVQRKFPNVPEELKTQCVDLKLIESDETKLSSVISVVAENYGHYHECKIKVESWIEWYERQKKIFESVK